MGGVLICGQNFQYPRTDRRCCDPPARRQVRLARLPFSILERIDDVVTVQAKTDRRHVPPFSILERIDDVVTEGGVLHTQLKKNFQYPRTDRRCCDEATCEIARRNA